MVTRIGEEIVKKAVVDQGGDLPESSGFDMLLRASTGSRYLKDLDIRARPKVPIVGVGAPAEVFIKPLEARLDCPVLIPENHDVGNAVGAVLSQVTETVTVRIFPKDFKYIVFGPGSSPMVFTIEPGVYVPGYGGIRIEDDVVVKKDGCELLTTANKEPKVI